MAPVMLAAETLEVFFQQSPHSDNAIRHLLDFTEPLLIQSRVVENLGRDPGPVYRRV